MHRRTSILHDVIVPSFAIFGAVIFLFIVAVATDIVMAGI